MTMIAVLHHLGEIEQALQDASRLLAPGGQFLSVGLAQPQLSTNQLWEAASVITNPMIGYVKQP